MKLAQFQSAFAQALLGPDDGAPGRLAALRAQPAFAVYRNTVMTGCIDALEANFPSVTRLVGRDWLRAAAALYVVAEPPHDARMLRYGDGFAEFLDQFEPARELPYLADVARLDRCWTEAHAAADAAPLDGAWLTQLSPDALGQAVLTPHPTARWRWFAQQPIYSIWQRNRVPPSAADSEPPEIDWQGEGALLTRPGDTVIWCPADAAACAFLDACAQGHSLGDAAAAALDIRPETDLAALLSRLLHAGALCVAPPAAT